MLTTPHLITKAATVLINQAEQLPPLNHDCSEFRETVERLEDRV